MQSQPNTDLRKIKQQVKNLSRFEGKKLKRKICDIIDLKGFSISVLLFKLPSFSRETQLEIVKCIEDLFFFHPRRGLKLLKRLCTAIKKSDSSCRVHLLCAIADILASSSKTQELPPELVIDAMIVLNGEKDLMRKGKAVEILSQFEYRSAIPDMLEKMIEALSNIDAYENFKFVEIVMFAIKRLGGDTLLRLVINPSSNSAQTRLRLDWKEKEAEEIKAIMKVIAKFDSGLSQVLLKFVELSEFAFPFLSMVQEGLLSEDKWVRQAAVSALGTIDQDFAIEQIAKMLKDESAEVRLMAVTGLGNFPPGQTGEQLKTIAFAEQETIEIRLNALYALFSQKNSSALDALVQSPTRLVSVNALGLKALLMEKIDGLKFLLEKMDELNSDMLTHLFHYLLEISNPESLIMFVNKHSSMRDGDKREAFIDFLKAFLEKQAGPNLETEIMKLTPAERSAIRSLIPSVEPTVPVTIN
ncbi:MAG: HEAT repeat domain-containing protein [Candidatus Riflebacteria bacterium]|nr:HEAT repeat domain-containing protein [Candidatus Riflebacteria bacterium]